MFWWIAVAVAAPPRDVFPVLAPADAPQQYAEFVVETRAPASELACDPYWPDVLLCFKVVERGRSRWVTAADLTRWATDVAALRALVVERAGARLAAQPKPVTVEGMPGVTYWVAAEGDGWAAAGALRPDLLEDRVGGAPFLVAAPTESVLLVWKPGNPELDRVMAVGAKEMFETQDGPVSPVVRQWTGTRWAMYAEAVQVKPPDLP